MKTSTRRPAHWPEPVLDEKTNRVVHEERAWVDAWGAHELKDGTLTTDYADPAPVAMVSKRKHRRP